MRIERYPPRPKRSRACGCAFIIAGLGVMLAIFAALAVPMLPAIALRIAGFEPVTSAGQPMTAAAVPIIQVQAARPAVILSAVGFGQMNLPASPSYSISAGQDESGADTVQITIRAEGIHALCSQYTDFCGDQGNPFRRAKIALESGAAVIIGEAFVELLNVWQAIELRLSLSPAKSIQIDSVGIDGIRYRLPDNELGRRIGEVQASANQMLRGLSVRTGGKTYSLFDIIITESQLVAVFR